MPNPQLRIQLVSDRESIDAVRRSAAEGIASEPTEVSNSDQRFGIAELTAIIVVVKTALEVAVLLADAFKAVRGPKTITIKTPKGSVTIQGDGSMPPEAILEKLQAAGVL